MTRERLRKGLFLSVVALVGLSIPVSGAERRRNGTGPAIHASASSMPSSPRYGIDTYSVSSTWAGGMNVAYSPATIFSIDNGGGFYHLTAPGDNLVGAIQIPSGVIIDYVSFENCDTVGSHYTLFLYDDGGPVISIFDSLAKAGCGWDFNAVLLNWQHDSNLEHSLTFYIGQNGSAPTDGTDGVRGINVHWYRHVSPAPGTATFNDVPLTDPAFQYIEALVASGVTAGCSAVPPLYCPDATLTRRQMAVFLSKALGLHWPD